MLAEYNKNIKMSGFYILFICNKFIDCHIIVIKKTFIILNSQLKFKLPTIWLFGTRLRILAKLSKIW